MSEQKKEKDKAQEQQQDSGIPGPRFRGPQQGVLGRQPGSFQGRGAGAFRMGRRFRGLWKGGMRLAPAQGEPGMQPDGVQRPGQRIPGTGQNMPWWRRLGFRLRGPARRGMQQGDFQGLSQRKVAVQDPENQRQELERRILSIKAKLKVARSQLQELLSSEPISGVKPDVPRAGSASVPGDQSSKTQTKSQPFSENKKKKSFWARITSK